MIKVEHTVYLGGCMYYGGEIGFTDIGSFGLHLFTTPNLNDNGPRGTFTTYFPISNLEYRRKHPTKAYAKLNDDYTLDMYDDWGCVKKVIIEDRATIDKIVQECREQELPVEVIV